MHIRTSIASLALAFTGALCPAMDMSCPQEFTAEGSIVTFEPRHGGLFKERLFPLPASAKIYVNSRLVRTEHGRGQKQRLHHNVLRKDASPHEVLLWLDRIGERNGFRLHGADSKTQQKNHVKAPHDAFTSWFSMAMSQTEPEDLRASLLRFLSREDIPTRNLALGILRLLSLRRAAKCTIGDSRFKNTIHYRLMKNSDELPAKQAMLIYHVLNDGAFLSQLIPPGSLELEGFVIALEALDKDPEYGFWLRYGLYRHQNKYPGAILPLILGARPNFFDSHPELTIILASQQSQDGRGSQLIYSLLSQPSFRERAIRDLIPVMGWIPEGALRAFVGDIRRLGPQAPLSQRILIGLQDAWEIGNLGELLLDEEISSLGTVAARVVATTLERQSKESIERWMDGLTERQRQTLLARLREAIQKSDKDLSKMLIRCLLRHPDTAYASFRLLIGEGDPQKLKTAFSFMREFLTQGDKPRAQEFYRIAATSDTGNLQESALDFYTSHENFSFADLTFLAEREDATLDVTIKKKLRSKLRRILSRNRDWHSQVESFNPDLRSESLLAWLHATNKKASPSEELIAKVRLAAERHGISHLSESHQAPGTVKFDPAPYLDGSRGEIDNAVAGLTPTEWQILAQELVARLKEDRGHERFESLVLTLLSRLDRVRFSSDKSYRLAMSLLDHLLDRLPDSPDEDLVGAVLDLYPVAGFQGAALITNRLSVLTTFQFDLEQGDLPSETLDFIAILYRYFSDKSRNRTSRYFAYGLIRHLPGIQNHVSDDHLADHSLRSESPLYLKQFADKSLKAKPHPQYLSHRDFEDDSFQVDSFRKLPHSMHFKLMDPEYAGTRFSLALDEAATWSIIQSETSRGWFIWEVSTNTKLGYDIYAVDFRTGQDRRIELKAKYRQIPHIYVTSHEQKRAKAIAESDRANYEIAIVYFDEELFPSRISLLHSPTFDELEIQYGPEGSPRFDLTALVTAFQKEVRRP